MSKFASSKVTTLMLVFGLTTVFTGCGGRYAFDTVPVQGVVTLDGRPLAGALVVFRPVNGRPSSGTTDITGKYELQYMPAKPGALPGEHQVSITTALEPDSDSDNPLKQRGRAELVPPQYNSRTTLTATVQPGASGPHDFRLESTKRS